MQLQVQGQDQILAPGPLALGQQLPAQFPPGRQPLRVGAVEVLAGRRLHPGGAEAGVAVADGVGEGRAIGVTPSDLALCLLAIGQDLTAPVENTPALDAMGGVELSPVIGLHEGQERGAEEPRQLPTRLIAEEKGEEQAQSQGWYEQGPARRPRVAGFRGLPQVIHPLKEKKGDKKIGAMQPPPQPGPGRRVHQSAEEVKGLQGWGST